MRKKLLSLALALVMCLGLAVPAFAEEPQTIWTKYDYWLSLSDYVSKETANFKYYSSSSDSWEWDAYTVNPGAVFTAQEYGYLMMRPCTLENGEYIEDKNHDFVYVINPRENHSFTVTEEHAGYWEMSFNASESEYWFLLHVTGEPATPAPEPTPEPAPAPNFTDVSPASPYADAINWAVSAGITKGTSTTTFSPDQGCTNAQILTFLWRRNGEPEPTITNPFTNSIPEAYAKAAIWAYRRAWYPARPLTQTYPAPAP